MESSVPAENPRSLETGMIGRFPFAQPLFGSDVSLASIGPNRFAQYGKITKATKTEGFYGEKGRSLRIRPQFYSGDFSVGGSAFFVSSSRFYVFAAFVNFPYCESSVQWSQAKLVDQD
jgi:hypothetical protein